MIQAAMMFALGFSVCGLIALALYSALSRRTRRLAEARVKRRFATKRQEFETERDELRARHAIDMQRLEREVRKLGDEATAYRLDASIKDIEINSLNSELDDKEDAIEDLSARLETLHAEMREGDRKLAESGTALRAARHALQMQASDEAFEQSAAVVPVNGSGQPAEAPAADVPVAAEPQEPPTETPESRQILNVADEIRRIADETEAEILQLPVSSSDKGKARKAGSGLPPPVDPAASPPPAQPPAAGSAENQAGIDDAEEQIQDAMEKIEALKTSSGRNAAE